MALAEIVILLAVTGLCYVAMAPLRRRIERALLRRWTGKGGATVIPLVRRGDGVYAPRRPGEADYGDKR